jgi:uncharacterized protein
MNALLQDRSGRKVRRLFDAKAFRRVGSHPMCPSGGALGVGNPIAATGLMKIVELYLQLSGQAGKRQVAKEAHRGVAQAWGDLMQVGTVVVMGSHGSMPNRSSVWKNATAADLPGTPLKGESDVPRIEYKPELHYAFDNGDALTTYLDGFKKGKIRASQCTKCGRMMIPTRTFCEMCNLQAVDRHFDMPDTGTVQTYTLSHVDWASLPLPEGQVDIFAVIAIDGAGEKMGLMHRLGEVDPADARIDMRVKAVWKPEEEREGSVTDLRYFRPMRPDEDTGRAEPVMIDAEKLTAANAKAFPGQIPMQYAYTAGPAGRRFYADLAAGKLTGTWCPDCKTVMVPPANFCEKGMHRLDPEAEARSIDPRSGRVAAATLVSQDRAGAELEKPVWVVQVEFPKATGSLLGRLEAAPEAEVGSGMQVEIVPTAKFGPENVAFRPVA